MNIIIKKITSFIPKVSDLLIVGSILVFILFIDEWQEQNWLGCLLLLSIVLIFYYYKKIASANELYFNNLLDKVSDAIITIDAVGSILTVNQAVEDMFGYQDVELINHNIKMLMPEPYSEMHDSFLANYHITGEERIIGKTRDIEALRKNGEVFEAELWVHKVEHNGVVEFMGIIRDVSEGKEVARMKTEFISTVSHELRTPLTSIRGSLGMLKSGIFGEMSDKGTRMVELAHNNTERLINLVNDILDVEKIQAGKMELHCEKTDINALVKQSIESNEAYAVSCQVTVEFIENKQPLWVYVDAHRLQQVMANLISNAAKFSLEAGVVVIEITKKANIIRVSVKDNGLGIPEEYRHKIFQKFSQVDSSDNRQKGGTGLGLNITKAIIEHHGGMIDYTTEEGKGSCFFFELTEYVTETPAETVKEAELVQADKAVSETLLHLQNEIKAAGHLLVLEDDEDIAQLLSLLLEEHNFKVTVCHNAKEAKALLKIQKFDGITVDLRLPEQDGLSFIREVRASEAGETCIPIVIISAEASLNENASTSALSIIDWINKPIDNKQLHNALQQILKTTNKIPKILHVEDNKDLIEMMLNLLANKVVLEQAGTLREAKEKMTSMDFDLIILDVGLPDGSGLELIPLINQQKTLVPVIIFSAQSVEEDIANQVDAALIKSQVSNDELIMTIKALITPNEGSEA